MKYQWLFVLCAAMFLNACAWVELTPEGDKVRVLAADEVSSCKKLGNTTANVADKVAGMKRKPNVIADNLITLARNAAAEMKGDTIVPATEIEEGKQKFHVYRCVGP